VARIELTVAAERDLIDIFLYGVEHFGLAQAERYAAALNDRIESAAENPSFGADYSFVRENVRRLEAVSHAIYYRVTTTGILVLRVLHGRMDPARHLE
jgi:toxin ParE1/3/4